MEKEKLDVNGLRDLVATNKQAAEFLEMLSLMDRDRKDVTIERYRRNLLGVGSKVEPQELKQVLSRLQIAGAGKLYHKTFSWEYRPKDVAAIVLKSENKNLRPFKSRGKAYKRTVRRAKVHTPKPTTPPQPGPFKRVWERFKAVVKRIFSIRIRVEVYYKQ